MMGKMVLVVVVLIGENESARSYEAAGVKRRGGGEQ